MWQINSVFRMLGRVQEQRRTPSLDADAVETVLADVRVPDMPFDVRDI